jgi:transcriptional regulator with XRE-family HTH domain
MTNARAAERLVLKLRDLAPDAYALTHLEHFQAAMELMPMRQVLEWIEGETVSDKCKRIGISRNTWYAWSRGEIRPNKHQAQRLAKLTGVAVEKFQGRR